MVISFPFSLYSCLLSTSKNRRPFLLKCSEKRGPLTLPSKRVGGPRGDSTHRGAAARPVPRGSTHLKSGPGDTNHFVQQNPLVQFALFSVGQNFAYVITGVTRARKHSGVLIPACVAEATPTHMNKLNMSPVI